MPFWVVSGVGRGMGVLDGVVIVEGEWALRGNVGCPIVICNQWGLCCVVVRERHTLPKLLRGGLGFILCYSIFVFLVNGCFCCV